MTAIYMYITQQFIVIETYLLKNTTKSVNESYRKRLYLQKIYYRVQFDVDRSGLTCIHILKDVHNREERYFHAMSPKNNHPSARERRPEFQ
jgi:hypothetical protein